MNRIKKLEKISLILVLSLSIFFTCSTVQADTNMAIGITTENDITMNINVDAQGDSTIIIDGIPVQEKFNYIDDALQSLGDHTDYNTEQINILKERCTAIENFVSHLSTNQDNLENKVGMNNYMIRSNENKISMVLNNTIYNKNRYDNLEERQKSFENYMDSEHNKLELEVDNFISNISMEIGELKSRIKFTYNIAENNYRRTMSNREEIMSNNDNIEQNKEDIDTNSGEIIETQEDLVRFKENTAEVIEEIREKHSQDVEEVRGDISQNVSDIDETKSDILSLETLFNESMDELETNMASQFKMVRKFQTRNRWIIVMYLGGFIVLGGLIVTAVKTSRENREMKERIEKLEEKEEEDEDELPEKFDARYKPEEGEKET